MSGTLLAQAAPGNANPVVMALNPPLPLGQGAESLYVEVSVPEGTGARSIASAWPFRLTSWCSTI